MPGNEEYMSRNEPAVFKIAPCGAVNPDGTIDYDAFESLPVQSHDWQAQQLERIEGLRRGFERLEISVKVAITPSFRKLLADLERIARGNRFPRGMRKFT